MAITVINVSSPNDHLGDTLRNANIISNNNFSDLDIRVNNKADLVSGKVPLTQLPTKTISTNVPTGIPADGDEWIIY